MHAYCIFDKVTITLSVSDDPVNVGAAANITWMAAYQYPNIEDYDGVIGLNDTIAKSNPGDYTYTVLRIGGDTFDITAFESNTVTVTFAVKPTDYIPYIIGVTIGLIIGALAAYAILRVIGKSS